MENGAAGAEERPGFAGIDGFVADDDGEEQADARAQEDAQPVDVEVIQTYQWGVAATNLEAWRYKSAEKTADGTLEALRVAAGEAHHMKKCVEDIVQSASSARGGKDSVVNGLVTILVPETELIYACDWLLGNGFTFCHMEVTEDTVGNGAIVDADINLAVRMVDLYRAAGDSRAIVEIDLHVVRYDAKLDHKASISINRTPAQIAKSWYDHKQTDEGKDDELSTSRSLLGGLALGTGL